MHRWSGCRPREPPYSMPGNITNRTKIIIRTVGHRCSARTIMVPMIPRAPLRLDGLHEEHRRHDDQHCIEVSEHPFHEVPKGKTFPCRKGPGDRREGQGKTGGQFPPEHGEGEDRPASIEG